MNKRYTSGELMAAITATQTDAAATKTELMAAIAVLGDGLSGVKADLSGVKADLSGVKADAIKTKNELVSLIVDVRNDLKQDISRLDHKIDGVETRLEQKIESNTDDIIGVMRDFMGLTDDRFNNHERRLVRLEH